MNPGQNLHVGTFASGLKPESLALMCAAESQNLFDGQDWYRLYAHEVASINTGQEEVWQVFRNSACQIVIPVSRPQPTMLRGRRVLALANYYTPRFAPIAAPSASREDWDTLARGLKATADVLELSPMPEHEPAVDELIAALHRAGMHCSVDPAFGNWFERPRLGFSAYWADRPSKLRNTQQRAARKFAIAGGEFEIVTGASGSDIALAIAAYSDVYAASWKPQESHPRFIEGLIALAARRGWLRLGIARMAGTPIAAHLWLVCGRKANIYKLAYTESSSKWSPGTLLGYQLMRHVIEQDQVEEIDYLSGDDPYKQLWMSQRRQRIAVTASNPTTMPGLLTMARSAWRARR